MKGAEVFFAHTCEVKRTDTRFRLNTYHRGKKMSPILEAKAVNKKVELDKDYEFHILKDVDLEIEEGEFVSVMGPSGSGKTTLLYNISGMDRMTSGTVKLKRHDISHLKEEELAKLD